MKTAKSPEEAGRIAAVQWETPACPHPHDSPQAQEWANGLLAGREALSWNMRNLVQVGSTCSYLSEAVSMQLGVAVAKSIFHIGAESPVMFRIGFILQSCGWPVPILDIDGWRRIGQTVNRALQGRELAAVGLATEPTWLECLAFQEGRDFMLRIIGHPAPADPEPGQNTFTIALDVVLPWMGGDAEHYRDKIPAPPGV